MTTTTFRNDRTHEEITLDLDRATIATQFAKIARDDNWLWFHMAKAVQSHREPSPAVQMALDFVADSFLLALGMKCCGRSWGTSSRKRAGRSVPSARREA